MKLIRTNTVVTMAGLLAMSIVGCATTQTPQELMDARSAYLHAQSGPATQFTPDQVHEAKVALDKAEQSFVDDPGDQKTKDLAYIAPDSIMAGFDQQRGRERADYLRGFWQDKDHLDSPNCLHGVR